MKKFVLGAHMNMEWIVRWTRLLICGSAIVGATLLAPASMALQFSFKYLTSGPKQGEINGIRMDGTIASGDFDRLIEFARSAPYEFMAVGNVYLDSNGGSVSEALKIAKLVKAMYKRVLVNESSVCLSSCFYIYAAAVERVVDPSLGNVGIHRPYYPPAEFGKLRPVEAENRYAAIDAEVRAWLAGVGVPGRYVEKMFSVSSKEMYRLSEDDILGIGSRAHWYDELAIANCGPDPTKQRKYNSKEDFEREYVAYFKAREVCMLKATRGDRTKAMDNLLGGISWRK